MPSYKSPKQITEDIIAPYRDWIVKGFVQDRADVLAAIQFPKPTLENTTVEGDTDNSHVLFFVDGHALHAMMLSKALGLGMAQMKRELAVYQELVEDVMRRSAEDWRRADILLSSGMGSGDDFMHSADQYEAAFDNLRSDAWHKLGWSEDETLALWNEGVANIDNLQEDEE